MRGYGSLKIPTAEATSLEKETHVFSTSKVLNEMMLYASKNRKLENMPFHLLNKSWVDLSKLNPLPHNFNSC